MTNQTVLIADDDPRMLQAMRIRLEEHGFNVIVAQDGYQAVDKARHHEPDVMVLDIRMPAGNGFSVQERIDKIEEIAGTPIIYVTGVDPDTVDRDAMNNGAYAVLHKPFPGSILVDTVLGALGYWRHPELAA
ncbi:MAG: response regulator [Phycisphaerales bacterium JB064]